MTQADTHGTRYTVDLTWTVPTVDAMRSWLEREVQATRAVVMECEDGSRIVFANFGSAPSVRVVDVFSTRIVNDDAG